MTKKVMYFKVEEIDPELAQLYLACDKKDRQRPLSLVTIARYARLMKEGRWKETPEPIAFDWYGNLINGQHRLHAVVEAEVSVSMTVAYDCDPEVFDVIDQGKTRSSSDVFTILYKKRFSEAPANSINVTAVASGMLQRMSDSTPEKGDVSEHALKHYKVIQRVLPLATNRIAGSSRAAAAFANAAIYFGSEKVAPLVERFSTAMWASTTDPLKALYERLARAKSHERRQDTLSRAEAYSLAVNAVRLCLTGSPATRGRIVATTRDVGQADEDRRIRSGEKVRGVSPEPKDEGSESQRGSEKEAV